jgi:hypothetical protein
MIIGQIAERRESAQVDRIHLGHVTQVEDQAQRADPSHRVHQDLAEVHRTVDSHRAVWPHHHASVLVRSNLDRSAGHRTAFRHPAFAGRQAYDGSDSASIGTLRQFARGDKLVHSAAGSRTGMAIRRPDRR